MPAGVRILVVDDDILVLDSTALALERAGYTVEKTADVFGLPLRAGRFRPNVVLLDMDLLAVNGDDLALTLMSLRVMSGCKVIFHSARGERSLAEAVATTGAAGYIMKGLPRSEFLTRLRELLAESPASKRLVSGPGPGTLPATLPGTLPGTRSRRNGQA